MRPARSPYGSFFRARNRITSGLSLGVAVIEAPLKSGTRLFVNEAADQGKEIFAVPGNADQPNCEGTNLLIKEGAKPVTNGWEVVSEFAALYPGKVRKVEFEMPSGVIPKAESAPRKAPRAEKSTKKVVDKAPNAAYIDLQKQLESLSPSQLKIIGAMDEARFMLTRSLRAAVLHRQRCSPSLLCFRSRAMSGRRRASALL